MEITKETLEKEINRLTGKIKFSADELRSIAKRIAENESNEELGFMQYSRQIAICENEINTAIARREAFQDILNNL